jgi:hypothetical protein
VNSADQSLLIGDDGSIKSASDLSDVIQDGSDVAEWLPTPTASVQDTTKAEVVNLPENTETKDSSAADEELSSRQRGDFSLYSFYLKSTAKWLWVVWLATVFFVSIAERLPGELIVSGVYLTVRLLNRY